MGKHICTYINDEEVDIKCRAEREVIVSNKSDV
jgi:hypothetical protein